MLPGPRLSEERVERVIVAHGRVGGHVPVGLDAVLEAVELPAGIADLNPGLADMHAQALTLKQRCSQDNGVIPIRPFPKRR